ncbi:MAG: hypothetical protein AAGH60_11260 [Pseudomonadota bacterium]
MADDAAKERAKRFDDQKEMSGRISETSRYVSFGLMAIVFSIYSSNEGFLHQLLTQQSAIVNAIGLAACLAIVSDYFQYYCGYKSVRKAISNERGGYLYDPASLSYRGRHFFFWMKQLFSLLGALLLLSMLAWSVLQVSPAPSTGSGAGATF